MKPLNNKHIVRALGEFYMIIAGLSVKAGVEKMLGAFENVHGGISDFAHYVASNNQAQWVILNFVIFIVTIMPFSLGAVRHLNKVYVEAVPSESAGTRVRSPAALAFDYFLLFFQGFIFVLWAGLLESAEAFRYVFLVVLIIDIIWGIISYLLFCDRLPSKAKRKVPPELSWVITNTTASTFIILTMFMTSMIVAVHKDPQAAAVLPTNAAQLTALAAQKEAVQLYEVSIITLIAVVRTLVDFGKNFEFYFGMPDTAAASAASGAGITGPKSDLSDPGDH